MKKGIVLIIFVFFFASYSFAFDDDDFQHWITTSASWKMDDEWNMSFEEEFRLGDDAGNLYYHHSDLGFTYSGITDWLDVGVNYRHVFEEKSSDWKQENRPHVNATVKWKMGDVPLSNRARFEYRNRQDAENYWRYSNKFSVKFPLKFTRLNIQPYIADEIFYDFNEETLNRNRVYAGFSFTLLKNLKAEIYYLLESNEKSKDWNDTHALGTKLKFSF
ncbi:MAG: DUF2490 domain-containing protein [Candidatus Omnitrophota bacterium]